MNVMACIKDALQHAFVRNYVEMAHVLELLGADDGVGPLVLLNWTGSDESERA